MSRSVRSRSAGVIGAMALAVALAACSDDTPEPEATTPTPTAVQTTATPTETTPAPTETRTETPTETASATQTPGEAPTAGGGAEELAAFLPEGFPIPDELTITGDPTATADNWFVTFTVPDPVATFDFYRTTLPEAGFELLPGSSETYSSEVSSGAILAQSDELDVNLLIVDDEVEIGITRR